MSIELLLIMNNYYFVENDFYFIIGNLVEVKRCPNNTINHHNMVQVKIQKYQNVEIK